MTDEETDYQEGYRHGARDEAARHADCCVDRQERAQMIDLIRAEVQAITRAYLDPDTFDDMDPADVEWWETQVKNHPFLSRARALLAQMGVPV